MWLACKDNAATRNGTVVTVGSCDWSDGLKAANPTVDRIVRNILNRLLE